MREFDGGAGGRRGVVAFDVDGVLLRGLFLSRMARLKGLSVWLRSLRIGLLLKLGLVDVPRAVEAAYSLLAGTSIDDLVALASRLELAPGAAEVCRRLKDAGYVVVLVSAGVPQRAVERIAARVGADRASGIPLEVRRGALTGRVLGRRHSGVGKREALEAIIGDLGFSWADTTVVVDDKSNQEIVAAAWRSVGVNPEYPILRSASFVLHTRDLREILQFFPEGYRVGITPQWLAVRHEAFRKAVHVCAVAVPPLALCSKPAALWLVGIVVLFFLVSELCRLAGLAVPIFSAVTWRAMRAGEARGVALGPLLFGIGIWLTIALFPAFAATIGVLVLAVGDALASLVGRAFGATPLPHNPRKTLVGSLSLFAVGVIIAMFYVSIPRALVVGAVACVVESFAVGALDNLLLPLTAAGAVAATSVIG